MTLPLPSGGATTNRVTLFVDQTALNNMLSGRTGDLRRVMAGFAGRATRNARALASSRFAIGGPYAHRRTGNYKRSIRSSFPQPDELRIEANVPYAAAIELGAGRHPIQAHAGKKLTFYWEKKPAGPGWMVVPRVNHPGNKPYMILTDAVLMTAKEIGF